MYHLVGEVQNTGSVPVMDVIVSIVCYDNYGVVVDSIDTEVLLDVLLVGRKAPFMYVASQENSAKINTYTVDLKSFDVSSDKPEKLEIISHSWSITGYIVRLAIAVGQVRNNGALIAIMVKIVATFYSGPDGTGNVVGVSIAVSSPPSLNPSEVGTFEIVPVDATNREHLFVSLVLTSESLEYSGNVVPEFPAMVLMIFMIATLVVAVTMGRKRGKPIF